MLQRIAALCRRSGALAVLCFALPVHALDLLESYDAALTEDPEYRAARAAADSGRETLPMAYSQLLPNLSLNASQMRNDLVSDSKDLLGRPTTTESKYESKNYSLTLRQALYRPNQYAGYLQAQARVEGVEAVVQKAHQDLAVRVAQAYFNVLLADEGLRQVEAQAQAIEAQLESARLAMKVGHGTRTDVDDAKARLDLNRARQLGARQQIDQARHELEILVNRQILAVKPIIGQRLGEAAPQAAQLDAWMERAEAASPDLRELKARVEAAQLEVDRAYSGHKPTVDLIVQRSINASDNVTNPGSRYDNSQIGVQISVPLYAGGYVNAQVRQAQAALEEAEQRLETARRRLATMVRKEHRGIEEGMRKILALQEAELSADQAVLSNKKGLQAGTRSRVDILNAEESRSSVRLELVRERIGYALSYARLLGLCGALDRESITQINAWLGE